MKSEFVSTTSHELRTPLAAIKESVMLVLDETTGKVSPQQGHFLGIARRNIDRLANLINELLDLSKIESGKLKLNKSKTALDGLIAKTVETLDVIARHNKVCLMQEVDRGMPAPECDPDRITQVIINLISNALKFTPAGGTVKVCAKKGKDVEGRAFVEVSVSDTGIGMDKSDSWIVR